MTASSKTVLYSFWRSSCAWRVRTALEWKGVSFEIQSVNLMQNGGGGEQFRDEFTKINPNQVRAYAHGHVIAAVAVGAAHVLIALDVHLS